jgi:SAM-dependent MidA family methyltransferase
MREVLGNPKYGYYMGKDVFGKSGDFITAPEISQMFGELIGVWLVAMWQSMGEPSKINLVEFGPGRGTLMQDMFRAIRKFPKLKQAISVHFIEMSPYLRQLQAQSFGLKYDAQTSAAQTSQSPDSEQRTSADQVLNVFGSDFLRENTHLAGKKSRESMLPNKESEVKDDKKNDAKNDLRAKIESMINDDSEPVIDVADPEAFLAGAPLSDVTLKTSDGIEVSWRSHLKNVPEGPTLVVAQEFFDALPVYQFQYTAAGWRERLVDIDDSKGDHTLKFVLAPAPTVASRTVHKYYNKSTAPPLNTELEISFESLYVAQDIGARLAKHGGAALFIDYGHDGPSGNSLRAIKQHKFVHPLSDLGECDLSCDVDFSALRQAITDLQRTSKPTNGPSLSVAGPATQGSFLLEMGIVDRADRLLQSLSDEAQMKQLIASFERLVSKDQMGEIYKVLAVTAVDTTGPKAAPYFTDNKPPGFQRAMQLPHSTPELHANDDTK